ncbi:MAG: heavy metal translocating P-type ATPase, partial [Limisphaerales bacterium]
MTCANCARHVTEAIQSVPEIHSAIVSLENRNAIVRWNSGAPQNIPAVIQAVKNAGYGAKEIQAANRARHESKRAGWQINLWLGISVTIFLMIGEWIFNLALKPWFQWLSFALAGIVQIVAGAPFYRGAWRQLKTGGSNMDTLVALGSTTAFGYSAWVLLSGAGGELYFMEAAAIITLISLGHWIEARVSEKAGGALKSLLHLAPQTARRIQKSEAGSRKSEDQFNLKTISFSQPATGNRKSEIEMEVPIVELKIGDEILLRPGDRVPVDGMVIDGDSSIDESMLTGESIPMDKKIGGELFTGTVNLNGRLIARVTATGERTALAHVIAAVQRAQTSRADIQRLGDRVSSIFVPIVVVIAIVAALWWKLAFHSATQIHHSLAQFLWQSHLPASSLAAAFIIPAAILIIACPCAMGLATPVAIMAGANAAARRGILVRDGVALERAGKVTAVIFDKTGTLTFGKPEVAKILEVQSPKFKAQSLAATLARNSTHPVSQAIAKISSDEIKISDWKEIRGGGVKAQVSNLESQISNSETARLGSLRWLKECGADFSTGEKFISEWSNQGA